MINGESYRSFKNIAITGKTKAIQTLIELKVSGIVVLSKKYYFIDFGNAQFKFCEKFKNEIEKYENGEGFLGAIFGYSYRSSKKNGR